ncbi:unnamed protein product [Echinostoma caproni]|uniref:BTB domain-containing protein n=1 Tax=Echinostoma caproni TaxID=27848 RepID=A0A183A6T6_9TREM|nr:unnamed protein product [Echinostoma caproni]
MAFVVEENEIYGCGASDRGQLGFIDSSMKCLRPRKLSMVCLKGDELKQVYAKGNHSAVLTSFRFLYVMLFDPLLVRVLLPQMLLSQTVIMDRLHTVCSRPCLPQTFIMKPNVRILYRCIPSIGNLMQVAIYHWESGRIYTWGDNTYHQLGRDFDRAVCPQPSPLSLPGSPIAVGLGHTHGLVAVRLPDAEREQFPLPIPTVNPALGEKVHDISCGFAHTILNVRMTESAMNAVQSDEQMHFMNLRQTEAEERIVPQQRTVNRGPMIAKDPGNSTLYDVVLVWGVGENGQLGNHFMRPNAKHKQWELRSANKMYLFDELVYRSSLRDQTGRDRVDMRPIQTDSTFVVLRTMLHPTEGVLASILSSWLTGQTPDPSSWRLRVYEIHSGGVFTLLHAEVVPFPPTTDSAVPMQSHMVEVEEEDEGDGDTRPVPGTGMFDDRFQSDVQSLSTQSDASPMLTFDSLLDEEDRRRAASKNDVPQRSNSNTVNSSDQSESPIYP